MKKIYFLFVLLLYTVNLFSQDYKHGIGIVAGSLNGLSYKKMVNENLAFQADLAIGLLTTRGQAYIIYNNELFEDNDMFDSKINKTNSYISKTINIWSIQFQPNLYHQKNIINANWGNIAGFIGGGITLGYSKDLYPELSQNLFHYDDYYAKVGANIITGIEFIFKKIPFTLGIDFRPGLGMLITGNKILIQKEPGDSGVEFSNTIIYPMFDWGLAMSFRYAF